MNNIEKKSLYSFLGLYIASSLLFLIIIGGIYYTAQKSALENKTYYELQHIADTQGRMIIQAQMKEIQRKEISLPKSITLALIDIEGKLIEGKLIDPRIGQKEGYFTLNNYQVFVSNSPMEHLNIDYVVVQSNSLEYEIRDLRVQVSLVISFIFVLISIIAGLLSILFMRPMRQKISEIENFINNITHELNTPITVLSMASNQALKDKKQAPKMLEHIAISTQQLYDIYRSLSYLSFDRQQEDAMELNIATVLEESISHYTLLCERKKIAINFELVDYFFMIPKTQLQLLFSNLIGNAIKYSPPLTKITLTLKEGIFTITDEGIGIEKSQQTEIFKRFKRGTTYSGGFGVGLNIVQSICIHHKIDLILESAIDKGTKFSLKFPLFHSPSKNPSHSPTFNL